MHAPLNMQLVLLGIIIGTSLSEPHINGYELCKWYIWYVGLFLSYALPNVGHSGFRIICCCNFATCKFTLVSVNERYVAIDSSVSIGVSWTARGTAMKAKSGVLNRGSYPYSKWAAFILAGQQRDRGPGYETWVHVDMRESAWTTKDHIKRNTT